MVVDIDAGKVVVPPEIHARGFAEDDAVFDEIRPRVVTAVEDALREGLGDTHQLSQVVRRTVGQWAGGHLRRRPMIIPVVVEV